MKKQLALIGTAVAALGGPLAQGALAMPADVTPVVQSQAVQPLPAVALELGSGQRLAQPVFGPTKAEQRADTLRGQALNQKYGLGTYKIGPSIAEQRADTLRGQALNQKYGLGTYKIGPSIAEQRADTLRGEALNRKYGIGIESLALERGTNDRFAADNPTRGDLVRSTPTTTSSSPNFQWGDAGIGAGVLLGVVALLGVGFFEVRQHHGRLGTS
jgi:hypothetical protein